MTKLTGLPEQTAQPRRAIGLRRRWIVSSILPVITILVLIAALVSIALGSNYYANASSALEAKATASTEYFNTYAMTSYDEYYRSATLYANSFEDSDRIELQFIDRDGRVEVSTRSLMVGSAPGTKDITDALSSGKVSSFHGVDPATGEKIIAASGLLKFNGRVVGVMRFVTATRNLDSQVLLTVLIICAAVFVVGVIGFLAISDKLIDLLTAMAMNANYTFVFLAPQEKLMQYFRVSLIAAVIVTIPVALYQVYAFAKPGLKRSESFFFRLVLLFGLALFCVGVLFAYKVTLPFMLNFLVTLEGTDYITASISIESYINLCLTMFIIFGCVFEMPLVTIILAKMGIANPEIMKKGRGVAIVLIFLVAAIITPPDIVSQCFVAVPMCLLYFISIFLSGIFYKPKTDDDDEDEDDEEESSDEE